MLAVRVGGPAAAMAPWLARIQQRVGRRGQLLEGQAEAALWRRLRDLAWIGADAAAVVRLHTLPTRLVELDSVLAAAGAGRHYSLGGHLAWAHFHESPDWDGLAGRLSGLGAAAVVLRGAPPSRVWLAGIAGAGFWQKVKAALDPEGRFGG